MYDSMLDSMFSFHSFSSLIFESGEWSGVNDGPRGGGAGGVTGARAPATFHCHI